jgi:glutaminyl-tRNA synthetase
VSLLRAEADLATIGREPEGRKVRGVIHWVSARHGLPARFRLYDRLFDDPAPDELEDYLAALNPNSLVETAGFVEPSVSADPPATHYQFERLGYFRQDPEDSRPDALVFNRVVALKSTFELASASQATAATTTSASDERAASRIAGAQRDPTAGLDDAGLARYRDLVARGAGEEEAAVLAADVEMAGIFDRIADGNAREASALVVHDLRRALRGRPASVSKAPPGELAAVLRMVTDGTLTRAAAGEVVAVLVDEGGDAEAVVASRGLSAVRADDALLPVIREVLDANPSEAQRFAAGEERLLGFLTGQVMRRLGKGADAARVQELLRERVKG